MKILYVQKGWYYDQSKLFFVESGEPQATQSFQPVMGCVVVTGLSMAASGPGGQSARWIPYLTVVVTDICIQL